MLIIGEIEIEVEHDWSKNRLCLINDGDCRTDLKYTVLNIVDIEL